MTRDGLGEASREELIELFSDVSYIYDDVRNMKTANDESATTHYDYDGVCRLTCADPVGTLEVRIFTYDAVGNRETKATNAPGVPVKNYAYDDANRHRPLEYARRQGRSLLQLASVL